MDVDQSGYDLGTLSVYYKIQSKTDPFRQGTDIYLSITDNFTFAHSWPDTIPDHKGSTIRSTVYDQQS